MGARQLCKRDALHHEKSKLADRFQGIVSASWKAIGGKQAASKNHRPVLPSGFDRLILGDQSRGSAEERNGGTEGRQRDRDRGRRFSAQRQIFISHRRDHSFGAHRPYYRDKSQFRRLTSTRTTGRQTTATTDFCRVITRAFRAIKSTRIVSRVKFSLVSDQKFLYTRDKS